jgi:cobalamin biosynthesis protein CbiG
VGLSSHASVRDVVVAVGAVLAEAGWRPEDVDVVATRERLAGDVRLGALDRPVVGFPDDRLGALKVPSRRPPADRPAAGPPVAEAAALLAVGSGGRLVVTRRTGRYVTVAAAAGPGR